MCVSRGCCALSLALLTFWCSETSQASGAEKRRDVPIPPATRPAKSHPNVPHFVESAESEYISANASEPFFRPRPSTRPPTTAPKSAVEPKPVRKRRATPAEETATPLMILEAYTS